MLHSFIAAALAITPILIYFEVATKVVIYPWEIVYYVLFTFESDETGKNYIVYTDNSKDANGNVHPGYDYTNSYRSACGV